MQRCRSLPGFAIFSICLLGSPFARAQDSATAEALFNKGLAEMQAGSYETACPAFAESQRLDPRSGTLFSLAVCEEKAGKIASAVAHYTDYLRAFDGMAGTVRQNHEERAQIAKTKVNTLQPEVPTLRLVLPAGAPAGARVMRDGIELREASLGIALPVDPGEHVITTQVPRGPLVEQRITLARREAKTLELELRLPAPVTQSKAEAKPMLAEPPGPTPVALAAPDAGSGRRIAGFIIGGFGIAGVAVGGIAGGIVLSKKRVVDDNCDAQRRCNTQGWDAYTTGLPITTISTVGFAVGLAGLAAGTVLVLTAPAGRKEKRLEATLRASIIGVGPNGGLIGVKGAF